MYIIRLISGFISLVSVLVMTGCVSLGNSVQEKSLTPIEMSHQSLLVVDKKVLMELIEVARQQGAMLNVAAYTFNDVTGTWDRARTLCNKEGDK